MDEQNKKKVHHRLSIYLLKEDVETAEDALKSMDALEHVTLKLDQVSGELYVQPARVKVPRWAELFGDVVDIKALGIHSSSAAAVMFVPAAGRLFALTFGSGRHLLRAGSWEERFGLKATLNAIDPTSLRSIDRKTFESLGRHVQEQTSRPAEACDFGLNVEQDMLRAATGTPRDVDLGPRFHGKDALVANVHFGLGGVVGFLERCQALSVDDAYKEEYPWVDHIAEVADAALKTMLDERLVEQIRSRDFEKLWLAVPETIDWARVEGFKFSERRAVELSHDLQFPDLLAQVRDPGSITVQRLKSKKALCFAHDRDTPIHEWSAYQCVCFEVDEDGATYLLSGGKWYRVATSFVEKVNQFVDEIPHSTLSLPACKSVSEGEYNRSVAENDPTYYTLLDRRLVSYGGANSKIEVCDLLTANRQVIHVKKYGGSSVLSHLFAQAAVSGELLFTDGEFRSKANSMVPVSMRFPDELRPADYEIVLAVITWSKTKLTLPFFSRVSLRAATTRLRGFGYRVSILPVVGPRPKA